MSGYDARTGKHKSVSEILFDKHAVDGEMDMAGLGRLCYDRGYKLSDDELTLAFQRLDSDGSGHITYGEFKSWWMEDDRFAALQLSEEAVENIRQLTEYFQYFDEDRSGTLDLSEFGSLFKTLLEAGMVTEHVGHVLEEVDLDGDGCVNLNEFVAWYTGTVLGGGM